MIRRIAIVLVLAAALRGPALAQADDASPPGRTVRLVFVHHSTGENWLADENGGLARELQKNGYFVSDTNYGWGPGGIGDRTDLVDWPEWFLGEERDRILAALFAEGETRSPYERTVADPGGENEIVLFKSCFPNSDLGGRPGDPPAPPGEYDQTVAGAKRIYLDLLGYFATRPDRLFVVVTAPPLSDPTHAANARAFNRWLVSEWLASAGYRGANVAVWDFYNVLTAPENHHRVVGGRLQHAIGRRKDTLHYPSDDDHPSAAGNRKATAEFVPALNVFYHRWRASAPPRREVSPPPDRPAPEAAAGPAIDGFEGGDPPGSDGWQAFEETGGRALRIARDESDASAGRASLRLDVDVSEGSWATCVLFFREPIDRSAHSGLRLRLRADRADVPFSILGHVGPEGERALYHAVLRVPEGAVGAWVDVVVPWPDLRRVDWEDGAGRPIPADRLTGIGLGFDGSEGPVQGTLWIDEVAWATGG